MIDDATITEAVAKKLSDRLAVAVEESIESCILNWTAETAIREALTPLITSMLKQEIEKPDMEEAIRKAVKTALLNSLPNMKLEIRKCY